MKPKTPNAVMTSVSVSSILTLYVNCEGIELITVRIRYFLSTPTIELTINDDNDTLSISKAVTHIYISPPIHNLNFPHLDLATPVLSLRNLRTFREK